MGKMTKAEELLARARTNTSGLIWDDNALAAINEALEWAAQQCDKAGTGCAQGCHKVDALDIRSGKSVQP